MVTTYNNNDFELIHFTLLSESDQQVVLRWRNDPSIRTWMLSSKEITMKQHTQFLASLNGSVTKQYWMVKKNKKKIGVVYLTSIKKSSAELGMYVAPQMQGQGLGTWMLHNFLFFIFSRLKLPLVKLEVLDNNLAAISLYKKAGFTEIGRHIEDNNCNVLMMEMQNENS